MAGGSVDLSAYLDDTDTQDISLIGNTLTLVAGGSVDLSGYLDDTDAQSLFLTVNVDNGTNPVADNATDTLNFVSGSGVTITGDSTTDTLTVAAVLGTTIDSSEIVDGTVSNADLANSSLTVTAGTGLTGGGAVSLGGTVTLNSALGTDIASAEIVDGTITATDVAGNVFIEIGRASVQTDTTTNSTIFVNKTGVSGNLLQLQASAVNEFVIGFDGTIDTASVDSTSIVDGSITNTDLANSAVTVTAGTGLTNGGAISLGGTATLNIGAGNGITVNADDITVRVAASADALSATTSSGSGLEVLGSGLTLLQGCSNNQVLKWNETTDVWACAADTDTDTDAQTLSLVTDTLSISGGNSVSLASYLDNTDNQSLFLTINADNGTDPVADGATDTLNFVSGSGVTITGDSTTDTLTIASVLGTSIDSSEITDGTVSNTDLANSSVTVTAGTGLISGGAISLGGTATLNIGAGNGITVNADDISVRVAASADGLSATTSSGSGLEVLASGVALLQGCANNQILKWNETTDVWACGNDVDTDTDAQNLFLTINADNGTDPAADGVTDTLNFASGAGVTITGDSTTDTLTVASVLGATVDSSSEIVDGIIANADLANSSLTVAAGNGLITGGAVSLGGTVTLNIGAGTGISVNADDIGITADGLNFTELSDTLSLDASTTISLGNNNLTTNLTGTGDFAIQFAGTTVFSILENGAVAIGNILSDQTIGVDNGTGTINIATDTDANAVNVGTGTGADTVTIGDSNANVAITDAQWSINAAGAANFASVTGAGLTDCDASGSKLLWDSTSGQFACGSDRASFTIRKAVSEPIASSTALQDDNELLFAVGANQTWIYEVNYTYTTGGSGTPDIRVGMNGPAGSTCVYQVIDIAHAGNANGGATACNTALSVPTTATGTKGGAVSGSITTTGTTGNAVFRWAQNTSNATATNVAAGSTLRAYRVDGADYAETYFSDDYSITEGMIVDLAGTGVSQVLKSFTPYSSKQIGVVSTKPGSVIGEADGSGKLLPIALNGRVPIKLSTQNGLPQAGDMITASDQMPGYGMLASKSGYIVGQLLTDAIDNGDGTASGYIYVRHGFWQSPVTLDLSSVFGGVQVVTEGNDEASDDQEIMVGLGLAGVAYSSLGFDQTTVDTILNGFQLQQNQIETLASRITLLEGYIEDDVLADFPYEFTDGIMTVLSRVKFSDIVTFDKDVVFSSDSSGSVAIAPGELVAEVKFNRELSIAPKIVLSPNDFIDGSWRVVNVTKSGFSVELSQQQLDKKEFTWQGILTNNEQN